jgi:hypothetical protein
MGVRRCEHASEDAEPEDEEEWREWEWEWTRAVRASADIVQIRGCGDRPTG